jgi:hypothetical protein
LPFPNSPVVLVGYETTVVLQTDPNITQYQHWWAPDSLPPRLRLRTKPAECEKTKLQQDAVFRTNSSLPVFPYRKICSHSSLDKRNSVSEFRNSYVADEARNNGFKRDVNGPYQANPLDSCVVRNMDMYLEPIFGFSKFSVCTLDWLNLRMSLKLPSRLTLSVAQPRHSLGFSSFRLFLPVAMSLN